MGTEGYRGAARRRYRKLSGQEESSFRYQLSDRPARQLIGGAFCNFNKSQDRLSDSVLSTIFEKYIFFHDNTFNI